MLSAEEAEAGNLMEAWLTNVDAPLQHPHDRGDYDRCDSDYGFALAVELSQIIGNLEGSMHQFDVP